MVTSSWLGRLEVEEANNFFSRLPVVVASCSRVLFNPIFPISVCSCALSIVTDNDLWDEPLPPAGSGVYKAPVAVPSTFLFCAFIGILLVT